MSLHEIASRSGGSYNRTRQIVESLIKNGSRGKNPDPHGSNSKRVSRHK